MSRPAKNGAKPSATPTPKRGKKLPQLKVYITPELNKAITAAARAAGLNKSAFARYLLTKMLLQKASDAKT